MPSRYPHNFRKFDNDPNCQHIPATCSTWRIQISQNTCTFTYPLILYSNIQYTYSVHACIKYTTLCYTIKSLHSWYGQLHTYEVVHIWQVILNPPFNLNSISWMSNKGNSSQNWLLQRTQWSVHTKMFWIHYRPGRSWIK